MTDLTPQAFAEKWGKSKLSERSASQQHFLDLCQSGLLRRMLFAVGEPPTEEEIRYFVSEAIRVFFAAYGPNDASRGSPRITAL